MGSRGVKFLGDYRFTLEEDEGYVKNMHRLQAILDSETDAEIRADLMSHVEMREDAERKFLPYVIAMEAICGEARKRGIVVNLAVGDGESGEADSKRSAVYRFLLWIGRKVKRGVDIGMGFG